MWLGQTVKESPFERIAKLIHVSVQRCDHASDNDFFVIYSPYLKKTKSVISNSFDTSKSTAINKVIWLLSHVQRGMRAIAADIVAQRGLCVCLSVGHTTKPCANGWTDRNAVWAEESRGSKESCNLEVHTVDTWWIPGESAQRRRCELSQPLL